MLAAPGTLLAIGRSTCAVATGQGALRLNRLRPQGTGEVLAAEWCRGADLHIGSMLTAT
jgi:methionyl-tRNA formyltransferase